MDIDKILATARKARPVLPGYSYPPPKPAPPAKPSDYRPIGKEWFGYGNDYRIGDLTIKEALKRANRKTITFTKNGIRFTISETGVHIRDLKSNDKDVTKKRQEAYEKKLLEYKAAQDKYDKDYAEFLEKRKLRIRKERELQIWRNAINIKTEMDRTNRIIESLARDDV